jgi:hypothetical protein
MAGYGAMVQWYEINIVAFLPFGETGGLVCVVCCSSDKLMLTSTDGLMPRPHNRTAHTALTALSRFLYKS